MASYTFATDSDSGSLEAVNFADACRQLDEMLTPAMLADGAYGWVEDTDGERYEIGNRG